MLEVRLLGQFDVRLDGRPIEIASRPARLLLAYLILSAGTSHSREKLAALLWPETSEANARSNLRHILWMLRKALEPPPPAGDGYLQIDEARLAFRDDADYWLDTAFLSRKLQGEESAEELMEVLGLYRGELLPAFSDEWVLLERARLESGFEHKINLLLERLLAGGRWPETLEWAESWIALGRAPEPAYRALMHAHAGLGNLSGVAAAYRRCVEALERDLGVKPSQQTREVYKWLLRGEGTPAVPAPASRPGPAGEAPPFKGLQYFDEADAHLFFGREALTAKLVGRLRDTVASSPDRAVRSGEGRRGGFLVIVGASGSGKSSLVRAGLIPALRRGAPLADGSLPPPGSTHWPIYVLTPTAHPLEALATSLTREARSTSATAALTDDLAGDPRSLHLAVQRLLSRRAGRPSARRLLLVIDQFEELFTLCHSEAERQAFVENLLTAASIPFPDGAVRSGQGLGGPTLVLLTLRADFYPHCAQYAGLRKILSTSQEYIGPMQPEELQRAIEEPAWRGGWEFEPGLVSLLLRDVGDEPGALPLLSHTLLETWHRRRGRTLTLAGYAEAGGVHGAIARTAETIYRQLLPPEQAIARSLFLRLTALGEGTQDTRRRALLTELMPAEDRPAARQAIEAVLQRLTDARLITTSEGAAEVAHEALIREWPTLRQWLNENREGLRIHRHLTEMAQAWQALRRDPGELYRGARLAQALEWAGAHPADLNPLEQAFLDASQEWAEQEARENEARRQRELEAARRLAEAEARRAEEQARAARLALTRELAAAAISNLEVDPERSILLALQAVAQTYPIDRTVLPEAEGALHQAVQASHVQLTLSGHTAPLTGVVFHPDGKRLGTASQDGTLRIWDVSSGTAISALAGVVGRVGPDLGQSAQTGPPIPVRGFEALALSPDGARLAASSSDGTVTVWDANSGHQLLTLPAHSAPVLGLAFSLDGKHLATASQDATARVWDLSSNDFSRSSPVLTLSGHASAVNDVAFSPDGARLATASGDRTARVWDAVSGEPLLTLSGHASVVEAVAFSPDGKRLATASWDATARVWDAVSGQGVLTLFGHGGAVVHLTFSADGTRLATAGSDGRAKVWDAASGRTLLTLSGHTGWVTAVALSPDGRRLATASVDRTAKVWDTAAGRELLTLAAHPAPVFRLAFSPEGGQFATASWDGTAKVWEISSNDLSRNSPVLTLGPGSHRGRLFGVTWSPHTADRRLLATAGEDGTAMVWELAGNGDPRPVLTLAGHSPEIVGGFFGGVVDVAFNPGGSRLATAGADGKVKVWDVPAALPSGAASAEPLLTLPGHSHLVHSVTFSPDGARLATAGWDGVAKMWDPASGELLLTLSGHTTRLLEVAFSPDGRRLATGSQDGTAKVWEAASGQALFTLSGHTGAVISVAFSPDGALLATASSDGTAIVWQLSPQGAKELFTLSGHTNVVFAVRFSPDGARLATAGFDGTVRLYLLRIEDLVALARTRVTRALTAEECRKFLHLEQCPGE